VVSKKLLSEIMIMENYSITQLYSELELSTPDLSTLAATCSPKSWSIAIRCRKRSPSAAVLRHTWTHSEVSWKNR